MDNTYLSLELDSGDRIAVYRQGDELRAVYTPAESSPRSIPDLRLDDDDESVTRLRARSLRMWLVVRSEGVVGGILGGSPASGQASYA